MLWLYGELGEVGDIFKKCGVKSIKDNPEIRSRFVEEMCDVMMYFNDILLCFSVSPEEFASTYEKKFQRNMERWKAE